MISDEDDLLGLLESELDNLSENEDEDEDIFNGQLPSFLPTSSSKPDMEDNSDDHEWKSFMESSITINENFKIIEVDVAPVAVTALDFEKDIHFKNSPTFLRKIVGSVPIIVPVDVSELIEEMVSAVERSARLCVSTLVPTEVIVDFSHLPKEITDDSSIVSVEISSSTDPDIPTAWASQLVSHELQVKFECNDENKQTKVDDEAEIERVLEEDRRARLFRRERRLQEYARLKREKSAVLIQSTVRCYLAILKRQEAVKCRIEKNICHAVEAALKLCIEEQIRKETDMVAEETARQICETEQQIEAARLLQARNEAAESEYMALAEIQSTQAWTLQRMLAEISLFRAEDEISTAMREVFNLKMLKQERESLQRQEEEMAAALETANQLQRENGKNVGQAAEKKHHEQQHSTGLKHIPANGGSSGSRTSCTDAAATKPQKQKPAEAGGASARPAAKNGWGGKVGRAVTTAMQTPLKPSSTSPSVSGSQDFINPSAEADFTADDGQSGDSAREFASLKYDCDEEDQEEEEYEFDDVEYDCDSADDFKSSSPSSPERLSPPPAYAPQRADSSSEVLPQIEDSDEVFKDVLRQFYGGTEEVPCPVRTTAPGHCGLQEIQPRPSDAVAALRALALKPADSVPGSGSAVVQTSRHPHLWDNGLDALVNACVAWSHWRTDQGAGTASHQISVAPSATTAMSASSDRVNQSVRAATAAAHEISPAEEAELQRFGLQDCATATGAVVTTLELSVEGLRSVAFLRQLTRLRKLELNVNSLRNLTGLEGMVDLREFSAKDNSLQSLDALRNLTELRSIKLDNNQLSELSCLASLPQLTTLAANTNQLVAVPCLNCTALQRLELYQNHISVVELQSLRSMSSLTHLDLGRNRLREISGAGLSQCPLLQTLVLSQNQIAAVPSPLYLPNLKSLWLSGNRLCDLTPWMPGISAASLLRDYAAGSTGAFERIETNELSPEESWPVFLPSLEKLYLQDNTIASIPPGVFCGMPVLAELDLSFNSIANSAALLGLAVGAGPILHTLQLQDNPVHREIEPSAGAVQAQQARISAGAVDSIGFDAKRWLMRACPGLSTLCGNPVCVQPVAQPIISGVGDAGSVVQSGEAVGGSTVINHVVELSQEVHSAGLLLAQFQATKRWEPQRLRVRDATSTVTTPSSRNLSALAGQKSAAAIELLSYAHHETAIVQHDNREFRALNRLDASCPIVRVAAEQLLSRSARTTELLHMLSGLRLEQASLRAREKLERRDGGPSQGGALPDRVPVTAEDDAYWDTALVDLLRKQLEKLLGWGISIRDAVANPLYAGTSSNIAVVGSAVDSEGQVGLARGESGYRSSRVLVQFSREPFEDPSLESLGLALDEEIVPPAVTAAVTSLQRVFRGSRTRKHLKAAIYLDDELEAMLGEGDDCLDNMLAGFTDVEEELAGLLKPVTLRADWVPNITAGALYSSTGGERDGEISGISSDAGDSLLARAGASMVYGDHRRGRRTTSSTAQHASDDAGFDRNFSSVSAPGSQMGVAVGHTGEDATSSWPSSRPVSAATDYSAASSSSPYFNSANDSFSSQQSPVASSARSDGSQTGRPRAGDVAEEWGIRDPKLLAMLMKRNKRMKHFVQAKEEREKEKDPQIRYQKFVKTALKSGNSAASVSGSFGGKPKTFRPSAGGGVTRTVAPPAWMLGAELEHDVD